MSVLTTTGAAFDNAFESARSRKTALIPNRFADRLIVEGKAELPRFWTGTVVAYPAPGMPFGDNAVFYDQKARLRYVLDTHAIKGERGVALVLEPGTYELVPNRAERIFRPKAAPMILPAFPQESGWFNVDEATLLPVLGHGKARFLWRLPSEAVLPAAREHGHRGWARFDIFLNQKPSSKFGALHQSDYREVAAAAVC
jgi:hypothetical protein